VWDIVKSIKDIVVGVWDLIWSLIYLISRGAAGSDNWLRVKTFFTSLSKLSDPGGVWDAYWDEQALAFQTIEGSLLDCRRAEYIVRKFIGALVNIVLILAAGYGIVKGAVAGVRAVAETAELAEIIGVRGVLSVGVQLATRRITRFVAVASELASELLGVIRQPLTLVRTIASRVRAVLIAAEDVGYWRYLRQQAGTAVRETAKDWLAGEQRFWDDNRSYWRERGLAQQTREENLTQDLITVQEHLKVGERPEPATTIGDLGDDAQQLDAESAALHGDTFGTKEPATTAGGVTTTPPGPGPALATSDVSSVNINQLIDEALRDFAPEPSTPLNPADFGPAPPRIVDSLRDINLNEIPFERRAYFEANKRSCSMCAGKTLSRGSEPHLRPCARRTNAARTSVERAARQPHTARVRQQPRREDQID
jgi:hypothetical protein